MAIKRKAVVSTGLGKVLKRNEKKGSKSKKAQEEEEVEEHEEEEQSVLRKPEEDEEGEEEAEQEEEEVGEEELIAQREEETKTARKKELKITSVDELKELVLSKGLEKGTKADMVEVLVAHEAKARADVRAQEARVRAVMQGKVAELEALSLPQIREQGAAIGLKGQMSKQAFVEGLLKQWQEEDGVDNALAKMSRDAREVELSSLDKPALRKICKKGGVDPFVKEVLVERLVRLEVAAGKFARPKLHEPEKEEPLQTGKTTMVDALLASEAARKKERELKKQQEEAAASRQRDLEGMTLDQLKKLAAKKKLEVSGKKTDLVAVLADSGLREELAAARKEHLRSLSVESLQKLLQQNGLQVIKTGKVDAMVDAFLAHETKIHEVSRMFELVVDEVLAKRKQELDAETSASLKELCESKGVKVGVSKEERVERYLEAVRQGGDADAAAAVLNRDKRSVELFALDEKSLVGLCEEAGVDPLVKEVMVDRLLAHEAEHGSAKDDDAPPAKKSKKSKE